MSDMKALLARLKGLNKKATAPQWRACTWDVMEKPHVTTTIPIEDSCHIGYDLPKTPEDADLIAETRNALPTILSYIAALEERNAKLRDALSPFASLYRNISRESCKGNVVDMPMEMPLVVNGTQWLVGSKELRRAEDVLKEETV